MTDYNKGQIYKITDIGLNKCYIGSTVQQLSKRMTGHRREYKRYLNKERHYYLAIFSLFDEFGLDNCKIEWIEDYPCNSKKELEAREGHYIKTTECINKRIEARTQKEWYEDNREKQLERNKRNYEEKRDSILEKQRIQYHNDKEHQHQLKKAQYEKHKHKKLSKCVCECGSVYTHDHKARHLKTNKHQQYLQTQTNPEA